MSRQRNHEPEGPHHQSESFRDVFTHAAGRVTRMAGSPFAVLVAALVIVVWAVTGPVFGFSDTWQLVINTGTTIVTFLMVFVIQATQNRDSEAIHLKLDELIRAVRGARNEFITVERDTEAELAEREREMIEVAEHVGRETGHPRATEAARLAARAMTERRRSRNQPQGQPQQRTEGEEQAG
jgi:low affinity Fe/Cu permease